MKYEERESHNCAFRKKKKPLQEGHHFSQQLKVYRILRSNERHNKDIPNEVRLKKELK